MTTPSLTGLLQAWCQGDARAGEELMPLVYAELHRRAAAQMRGERRDHSLQPTALVHEAYLRLVRQNRTVWRNRAQFFAIASQMMRRILVDHARRIRMAKRPGRQVRVTLDEGLAAVQPAEVSAIDLDVALTKLAEFDPRKSRIAELRFFGGLSLHETADVLDLSVATVERDWQAARAWLYGALQGRPQP